jgi:hypothetical protein
MNATRPAAQKPRRNLLAGLSGSASSGRSIFAERTAQRRAGAATAFRFRPRRDRLLHVRCSGVLAEGEMTSFISTRRRFRFCGLLACPSAQQRLSVSANRALCRDASETNGNMREK